MIINLEDVWGQIAPHTVKYMLLLVAIAGDIITGLVHAIKNHDFQSSAMRQGLSHKMSEIASAVFGTVIDGLASYSDTNMPISFSSTIITYVVLMEIGSIAENLGFALPDEIKKYLPNKKE